MRFESVMFEGRGRRIFVAGGMKHWGIGLESHTSVTKIGP